MSNSVPTQDASRAQVFLIEDDASMRKSVSQMLRFAGYTVHDFAAASSFLEISAPVSPAVIITDMRMPGMTGVELQAVLLKRDWPLPIIFISGESSVQQSITAMKQGAIEFLLKPFSRSALLSAVARGIALDIRQQQAALQISAYETRLKILSPRERQVYELLANGHSNAELMDSLGISLPTAKQYKAEVMRKLELHSLSALIQLYKSGEAH